MFLLGREAHVAGWNGSGRMSGFEGSTDASDATDVDNAVREFVEESLGVLVEDDGEELNRQLSDDDFAVRVCIHDPRRASKHCTFVKRFDWPPGIEEKFAERRSALEALHNCGLRAKKLAAQVPSRYPFVRHDQTICVGTESRRVVSVEATINGSSMDVRLSLQSDEASPGQHERRFVYAPVDESCVQYVEMLRIQRDLVRRLDDIPRSARAAVRTVRSRHGALLGASVRKEWLEKSCVHEYSLYDLAVKVQTSRHLFRPYFPIVVRETLAQFVSPAPDSTNVHRSWEEHTLLKLSSPPRIGEYVHAAEIAQGHPVVDEQHVV